MSKNVIKRMLTFAIVGIFLSFLPAAAGFAEDLGHLQGIVYESDGTTPLKDAGIVLEYLEKGKKTETEFKSNITDDTGKYKIENVPVGKYRGKIMLNGKHYRIKKVDFFVHIIKDETNFVSFALKRGRK
jgi:hypothetical protein